MAQRKTSFVSLLTTCLCIVVLLLLGHGSIMPSSMAEPQSKSCEAEFQRLQPLEPIPEKLRSEAGTVEFFDEASRQLLCVGAFVFRAEIDREGLAVPRYTDDAGLAYAQKGTGIVGFTFPGCPEAYYRFKQGDAIALPPGVPFWFYNDNDTPLELIFVFDGNNGADELERKLKEFVLGGSNRDNSSSKGMLGRVGGQNILSAFRTELLGESIGLDGRLTRSLQGQNTRAINIVRVQGGGLNLGQVSPVDNGSTMCRRKLTMNLEHPENNGPNSPRRITSLTGRNFPILNSLQLSVERGSLNQSAVLSPSYVAKAQSVVYMIRGGARLQVVDNRGVAVLDGELRQGQLLVIPEYFVILAKAGKDGAEYITFKTDANPVIRQIAGPGSVLRGLPVTMKSPGERWHCHVYYSVVAK